MRLIPFTNLYPSDDMPRHGVFVKERLRQLLATGAVTADVVALRPGFRSAPVSATLQEPAGQGSDARLSVRYLPIFKVPGISNWIDPLLMARSALPVVRALRQKDASPVILDGHFLYPDGVAAVIIGRKLGIPVVLSARGSDVNVKCRNPVMRRWVQWAVARSDAVITVSQALAATLADLDIRPRRTETIQNGVDHERFRPRDKSASRQALGATGWTIVSVGNLVPEKGHAIAIEALAGLPDVTLLVVGDGPERMRLQDLARRIGVSGRVRFTGLVPHDEMSSVYSAADALVLPSLREGMPNVVLESLACGTPVAATRVGGIPEIIRSAAAGELMSERSAQAMRDALVRIRNSAVSTEDTRAYSRQFGWQPLIARQLDVYKSILDEYRSSGPAEAGIATP